MNETDSTMKTLRVTSKAFQANTSIPIKYTCEGNEINPPLDVNDVPGDARSLALIVDDPDAAGGTWLHWLVWNIPVSGAIEEGARPGVEGINDFRRTTYGGPCPPSGTHRYFFRVYALDRLLDLTKGAGRIQLEQAMRDHILAYGELVGRYKKSGL